MISFFEEPLNPGWIYPCSLDEIRSRLDEFPEGDLIELHSVGLVASTRRNCAADARYLRQPHPRIHICSYPASMEFKLPAYTKHHEINRCMADALSFGMRIEQRGSRFWSVWRLDLLNQFIVDYVIAHEVGHHVYWLRYAGASNSKGTSSYREQFANDYAWRHLRKPAANR